MLLSLPFLIAGLGGCASVVSGTTQEMTVNTSPEEADCILERDGKRIGQLNTPGTMVIKKTKHDIKVTCEKEGYAPTVHMIKSEIEDATWGNILLGGGVGWAVDSARGADNKYPKYVNITLAHDGEIETQEQDTPAPVAPDSVIEKDPAESECC